MEPKATTERTLVNNIVRASSSCELLGTRYDLRRLRGLPVDSMDKQYLRNLKRLAKQSCK